MKSVPGRAAVLCIALIATASTGCPVGTPAPVEFLDGRFSVLKPGGWSLMSNLNDAADLQMGNLFREAYCTVLSEARVDFAGDMTLERFSERTRDILLASLSDVRSEGPEPLLLGGRRAVRHVLLGTIDDVRVKYWHVSIETPTHYHQVVLWSLPSKFEGNRPDFEAVLASIRPAGERPPAQRPG